MTMLGLTVVAPAAAATGGPGALTTQFPLGKQKLCCAGPARTGKPATTVTSPAVTSPAVTSPAHARTTSSLARHRGGGVPSFVYILGPPLIALVLVLAQVAASTARRRRGRARAADPSPQLPTSTPPVAPITEPPAAITNGADARRDSAAQRPAATMTAAERIADEAIVRDALNDLGAGHAVRSDSSAIPSGRRQSVRRARDGGAAFRIGQMLYNRGHFEGAAAAWRLAASKQHARAATRLGMMCEERGDLGGAQRAYENARRLGDPTGADRAAALTQPRQT